MLVSARRHCAPPRNYETLLNSIVKDPDRVRCQPIAAGKRCGWRRAFAISARESRPPRTVRFRPISRLCRIESLSKWHLLLLTTGQLIAVVRVFAAARKSPPLSHSLWSSSSSSPLLAGRSAPQFIGSRQLSHKTGLCVGRKEQTRWLLSCRPKRAIAMMRLNKCWRMTHLVRARGSGCSKA